MATGHLCEFNFFIFLVTKYCISEIRLVEYFVFYANREDKYFGFFVGGERNAKYQICY